MKHGRLGIALGSVVATGALLLAAAAPAGAAISTQSKTAAAWHLGTNSLASVLTTGKVGFDHNSHDFDVLTALVLKVLADKPSSPVKVLTDGSVKLTAFLPTDAAFRRLVDDLTGKHVRSEKKVFRAVMGLGVDTVEAVLEYHVVPGARITARKALKANGASLTTALGKTIKVRVVHDQIRLRDKAHKIRNPRVILSMTDINKGNRQIAHAINGVLLPISA